MSEAARIKPQFENGKSTKGSSIDDALPTVDEQGNRIWIYARQPRGKWYRYRSYVGYTLLAILFALPFIKVDGHPYMLFNFAERQFILFGNVFWPQDFFLFVIGFITFILFIILFTAIFGRLWCGWACPQTIFLEMVFRRIEYWFEGDAASQRRLAATPWNLEKLLKKGGKQIVFFAISFFVANIFLAYFIGTDNLYKIINEPVSKHIVGLIGITAFSGIFYGVFAFFREQVCTVVCPYGRIQSVMLDKHSLTVAYDYRRGEPREKWGRRRPENSGDCIDCRQCIEVCPSGIDIRAGMQLECINCTACVDACDGVMKKIGKPGNLIRYASEYGIEKGEKFVFNTRRIVYSVVMLAMAALLTSLILKRSDIQATILRTPGLTYIEDEKTHLVKNLYNVRVLNKTFKALPVEFKLESGPGKLNLIGKPIVAPGDDYGEGIFSIEIPRNMLHTVSTSLKIEVYSNGKKMQTVKTNFMGPMVSITN